MIEQTFTYRWRTVTDRGPMNGYHAVHSMKGRDYYDCQHKAVVKATMELSVMENCREDQITLTQTSPKVPNGIPAQVEG